MLVELRPDRTLQQGKRLANLALDLGDLNLNLKQLRQAPARSGNPRRHCRPCNRRR